MLLLADSCLGKAKMLKPYFVVLWILLLADSCLGKAKVLK